MVTYQVERAVAGEPRTARRRPGFLGCDANVAYTFIAPASFLLIILVAYPFALSVWLSLSDARVGNTGSFVGLANFSHLLSSPIFLQTLQNTIVFTAAALGAKTVLGMGLALLRQSTAATGGGPEVRARLTGNSRQRGTAARTGPGGGMRGESHQQLHLATARILGRGAVRAGRDRAWLYSCAPDAC
jgi:hypothetical protein